MLLGLRNTQEQDFCRVSQIVSETLMNTRSGHRQTAERTVMFGSGLQIRVVEHTTH
jgi:hypothetical protein